MKQFIKWLDRDAPEWVDFVTVLLIFVSFIPLIAMAVFLIAAYTPWIIPLAIIAFLIYTGVLYRAYLKESKND